MLKDNNIIGKYRIIYKVILIQIEMMKRLLSIAILFSFVLLNLGFVSGQSCGQPNDDQLVMRISGSTNAHGELFDQDNYFTDICYDDFDFNGDGSLDSYTGAIPHPPLCGSDIVLRLSDVTNAHAETPESSTTGYIDVCFGDLSCVSSNTGCASDETEVLRLSANTNAHLETITGAGTYPVSICCTAGAFIPQGGGQITSVEWQDLAGGIITQSNVGNTVRLVAETNYLEGTSVTFNIKENDLNVNDEIRTNIVVETDNNGKAFYEWKITQTDIDLGSNGEGADPNLEMFFEASVGADKLTSEDLDVLITFDNNSPPQAIISGVVHRGVYFADTQITFDSASTDADLPNDALIYEWTIEHNDAVEFTSTQKTFPYTFAAANVGQRTITLKVTDSTGDSDEAQIGILVVSPPPPIDPIIQPNPEKVYVFSFINEPEHHKIITSPSQGGLLSVSYKATESFALGITRIIDSCTAMKIECKGGICPVNTQNIPAGCPSPSSSINIINDDPDPEFIYNWETSDGVLWGGDDISSGTALFNEPSTILNDKWFEVNEVSSSTQETNKRDFTLAPNQCVNNGNTFLVLENGNVKYTLDTLTTNGCAGPDGSVDDIADNCCPPNHACTPNGCILSASANPACASHTAETACENDFVQPQYYLFDLAYDEECEDGFNINGNRVVCLCAWSKPGDPNGACLLNKKVFSQNNPTNSNECVESSCLIEVLSQTECIDGVITITTSEILNAAEGDFCDDSDPAQSGHQGSQDDCNTNPTPRTLQCGLFNIELPFFGYAQFIASLISVFIIYFILIRYRVIKRE